MCVDILLFFFIISMHCSQRCYSLYSYFYCTLPLI